MIRDLGVPVIRYPEDNFVSSYNLEDGTGDKSLRPKKIELAWRSVETNEVGIDEFQKWAAEASPYLIQQRSNFTKIVECYMYKMEVVFI